MTLDGVIDAPTWTFDYGFLPEMENAIGAVTDRCRGILLGRMTYEMFEPAWSTRTVEDDPGAPFFNDTTKYVVSSTLKNATWRNSKILGPYDPGAIRSLKDEVDGDIYVSGSGTLVRRCSRTAWSTSCICSCIRSPAGPAAALPGGRRAQQAGPGRLRVVRERRGLHGLPTAGSRRGSTSTSLVWLIPASAKRACIPLHIYNEIIIMFPWMSSKPWLNRPGAQFSNSWPGANGPRGTSSPRFPALTQPAVSRHLRILRESRLVDVRADGTRRVYSLRPAGLAELDRWLDTYRRFWGARLDKLEEPPELQGRQRAVEEATGADGSQADGTLVVYRRDRSDWVRAPARPSRGGRSGRR